MPQNATKSDSSDDFNILDLAGGKIVFGAVFLGLAYYLHTTFAVLESGVHETVRLNWIVAILYKNLGARPTVFLAGLAGTLGVLMGTRQFFRERE